MRIWIASKFLPDYDMVCYPRGFLAMQRRMAQQMEMDHRAHNAAKGMMMLMQSQMGDYLPGEKPLLH